MEKMSASKAGKLGWVNGQKWRDQQQELIQDTYLKSPKICQNCNATLPYEKRRNKYCNHSCAAKKTNLGVTRHGGYKKTPCIFCSKVTKNISYCSPKCHKSHVWAKIKKSVEEIGFDNLGPFTKIPKRYLLETRGPKCEICGIIEWQGQPTPIVLDHINGHSDDWELTNLRLICPNCDAQTPTYKGKNVGNGRHYRRKRYNEGKSY